MKVNINDDGGIYRLTWTYQGKRYRLRTGIAATPENKPHADKVAYDIFLDCVSHKFDPDAPLTKYLNFRQEMVRPNYTTAVELFQAFIDMRARSVHKKTLYNYYSTLKLLEMCIAPGVVWDRLDEKHLGCVERAIKEKKLAYPTIEKRCQFLVSAWDWWKEEKGMQQVLNPWLGFLARFPVPTHKRVAPLTLGEIERIIKAFKEHPTYHYYTEFVEVQLSLGTRPGELCGLRWGAVSEDCTIIHIHESWTDNEARPVKSGSIRSIGVSPRVQDILRRRLAALGRTPQQDDFVFVGPKGAPFHARNFRNRAWKPILAQLGITYRKPYVTRSTFVTQHLERGESPINISQVTGHDPQTMFRHYVGYVKPPEVDDYLE